MQDFQDLLKNYQNIENIFRTGLIYAHILTKNSKIKKRSDFLDIWIFQYFGNFSTDPGSPAIKFFRTGLTYAFILR